MAPAETPSLKPVKVVARMLLVHVQTVRRAFQRGEIDGVQIGAVIRVWWPLREPRDDSGTPRRRRARRP